MRKAQTANGVDVSHADVYAESPNSNGADVGFYAPIETCSRSNLFVHIINVNINASLVTDDCQQACKLAFFTLMKFAASVWVTTVSSAESRESYSVR